ncbi:MAG: nucleotide exchange factor GrpE [Halobacteriota archaeon]
MYNDSESGNDRINEFEERLQKLHRDLRSCIELVELAIDNLVVIKGEFSGMAKVMAQASANLKDKKAGEELDEIRDAIEILEEEFEVKRQRATFLCQHKEAKKEEEYSTELKYLRAEFENYKRRAARDKQEFAEYILRSFISELLPIKDHLELAIAHAKENDKAESMAKGVELTVKQFQELLGREGVGEIKAVGEKFDPFRHEIVLKEVSATQPENTVIDVTRKGYVLRDKVLRPAMVKIATREEE